MAQDWEAQQRKVLAAWQTAMEKSPQMAFARQWFKQPGSPATPPAAPDPIADAARGFGDFSSWAAAFASPKGIDKAALDSAVLDLRRRLQAFELAWKKTPYWPLVAPDSLLTMLLGGASGTTTPGGFGGAFLPPLAFPAAQWAAYLPKVGPAREWAKRTEALGEAQSNYGKAVEALGRIHFQLAHQGLEQFAERLKGTTEEQAAEPRKLYDAFVDTIERGYQDTARSEPYSNAFGEVINAASGFKQVWGRWMDEILAAWHLPTQSEVSQIAERLSAVDERLEALEARLTADIDLRGIRSHLDALTDQLNQLEDDVVATPTASAKPDPDQAAATEAAAPVSTPKRKPTKKPARKKPAAAAGRKKRPAKKTAARKKDEFAIIDIGGIEPPSSE